MDKLTANDKLLAQIKELIPDVVRTSDELTREEVQTVVWLVGLATGFLGLLAAKPEALMALGRLRHVLIPALLGVALAGVTQRLLQQIKSSKERKFAFRLQIHLWLMTERFDDPSPLQDWWTEDEILKRLREDLGMEYDFLRERHLPIEAFRDAYQGQFRIWEDYEKQKVSRFQGLMAAIAGNHVPEEEQKTDATDSLNDIRVHAQSINRWTRASTVAYWILCGLFGFVAVVLTVALMG